jgi:Glycine/D-amino acid oxidases (deaminating)
MTRKSTLPQNVEVVVIGGGVVGCSIAYHLAKKNVNTVLLERKSFNMWNNLARCWACWSIKIIQKPYFDG